MPFAGTQMQLDIIILSEVSQTEKDKYHMMSLICGVENMTQVKLSMKQKQTHIEKIYNYQRGKEGDTLGVWD